MVSITFRIDEQLRRRFDLLVETLGLNRSHVLREPLAAKIEELEALARNKCRERCNKKTSAECNKRSPEELVAHRQRESSREIERGKEIEDYQRPCGTEISVVVSVAAILVFGTAFTLHNQAVEASVDYACNAKTGTPCVAGDEDIMSPKEHGTSSTYDACFACIVW